MGRTTIRQIISIHRSYDSVGEAKRFYCFCKVLWFFRIQWSAKSGGPYRAEATAASADVSHYHEGSRTGTPAFSLIGAVSFIAYGMKAMTCQDFFDMAPILAMGKPYLEPGWLWVGN